ncbi:MAG: TIGR02679 family protein [Sporichthyaceae bacterium]
MTPPQDGLDTERIRRVLGTPELAWLVERVSRRVARGKPLTGTLTLSDATAEQRAAVAHLLGRFPGSGASVSVPLEVLEQALQDAEVAPDLRAAVEVLTGPLRDLVGERATEDEARAALLDGLRGGPHAEAAWYGAWVEAIAADGTLTRLLRRGEHRVAGQAAAVLGRLPAEDMPLPVLAERVTGATKALTSTALATLVLRALALRAGRAAPSSATQRRDLWESAGVILDDLASQVLVLNVTGREDHVVADWLSDAAGFGIPFRLTLHQLCQDPLTPAGRELYVCENPAVLRIAAGELAARCVPLVCTEGQPSAACGRLIAAAARAGVRVHWRGDFDWTGLRSTATAIERYGARPWRMDAAQYVAALDSGESELLKGSPAPSPWDPALATRMTEFGRAIMEERLIPMLLMDLGG